MLVNFNLEFLKICFKWQLKKKKKIIIIVQVIFSPYRVSWLCQYLADLMWLDCLLCHSSRIPPLCRQWNWAYVSCTPLTIGLTCPPHKESIVQSSVLWERCFVELCMYSDCWLLPVLSEVFWILTEMRLESKQIWPFLFASHIKSDYILFSNSISKKHKWQHCGSDRK